MTNSSQEYKESYPPDETWEVIGVKNKKDFFNKYVVHQNTHKNVPDSIIQELKSAEVLQEFSYHYYPMYGDAFLKLTKTFEIAIKLKAKTLGINTDNKPLGKLISLISVEYPESFLERLDWARKMRNTFAHPTENSLWGAFIKNAILSIMNIINDIFRTKQYYIEIEESLRNLENDSKRKLNGLWVYENNIVYLIKPIQVRGEYSLWKCDRVFTEFPSMENLFTPTPIYFTSKGEFTINDRNIHMKSINNKEFLFHNSNNDITINNHLKTYLKYKEKASDEVMHHISQSLFQKEHEEIESFKHIVNSLH